MGSSLGSARTAPVAQYLADDDPMLRSLDAIHLATALLIHEDVDVLLSYDDRLTAAAASHGLETASPR